VISLSVPFKRIGSCEAAVVDCRGICTANDVPHWERCKWTYNHFTVLWEIMDSVLASAFAARANLRADPQTHPQPPPRKASQTCLRMRCCTWRQANALSCRGPGSLTTANGSLQLCTSNLSGRHALPLRLESSTGKFRSPVVATVLEDWCCRFFGVPNVLVLSVHPTEERTAGFPGGPYASLRVAWDQARAVMSLMS